MDWQYVSHASGTWLMAGIGSNHRGVRFGPGEKIPPQYI